MISILRVIIYTWSLFIAFKSMLGRTSLGLLLGDLCHAPRSILEPLKLILQRALELARSPWSREHVVPFYVKGSRSNKYLYITFY